MRKTATAFILVFASSLSIFAFSFLASHPVTLFLLKGQGDNIQAFKISAYLNDQYPKVEAIKLSVEQKKEGGKLLDQKNESDLEEFSKGFGSYSAVIGMPGEGEGWPDYLGEGLKWIEGGMAPEVFDNLQWADRVYLAFSLKTPLLQFFPAGELPSNQVVENKVAANSTIVVSTLIPENHIGAVRVEILNGCGITNAAEWAARRMKGAGITIIDSGNADNFNYPKTVVRTSGEIPMALEEALGRLGLSKDSIQENPASSPTVDAVVIVGRDFHKLKGRRYERNHY